MTDPITPPPELVGLIIDESKTCAEMIQRAYTAGADQELEACCEWLENQTLCGHRELIPSLRRLRRPNPPSLKEQALQVLESAPGPDYPSVMTVLDADQHALIRRALEALDD